MDGRALSWPGYIQRILLGTTSSDWLMSDWNWRNYEDVNWGWQNKRQCAWWREVYTTPELCYGGHHVTSVQMQETGRLTRPTGTTATGPLLPGNGIFISLALKTSVHIVHCVQGHIQKLHLEIKETELTLFRENLDPFLEFFSCFNSWIISLSLKPVCNTLSQIPCYPSLSDSYTHLCPSVLQEILVLSSLFCLVFFLW